MSDAELRADLALGLSSSQIAAKRGISAQAVNRRRKRQRFQEVAVAVVAAPESFQLVSRQLDAMDELAQTFERTKLLMDACDRWLRDAHHPERYDIGPRGDEVMVTYWDVEAGTVVAAKATLQELIARIERHGILTITAKQEYADPRNLILSTAKEVRATVAQCIELAQMLADARAMQVFREALLSEIAKVDPDIAERIASAVRRILVLHNAPGGSDPVAAG